MSSAFITCSYVFLISQQDIDIIIYRFVSQINSRFHFGYVIVNPQSFSPFITASEFISKVNGHSFSKSAYLAMG
jgi:hypothetical protein